MPPFPICAALFFCLAAILPFLNRSAGKTGGNRILFTAVLPKRVWEQPTHARCHFNRRRISFLCLVISVVFFLPFLTCTPHIGVHLQFPLPTRSTPFIVCMLSSEGGPPYFHFLIGVRKTGANRILFAL